MSQVRYKDLLGVPEVAVIGCRPLLQTNHREFHDCWARRRPRALTVRINHEHVDEDGDVVDRETEVIELRTPESFVCPTEPLYRWGKK
jgi:hypothetical protein